MSKLLNEAQIRRAVEVLHEYLSAPAGPDGRPPTAVQHERDEKRVEVIEQHLLPLLRSYLSGEVPLADFKRRVDGINKQNEYWGFKGIKGQMFFNVLVNSADNEKDCDSELKAAITVPESEDIAASRIRTFASYVKRTGDHHIKAGGDARGAPKLGSVPFFLSYFWQVQDRETWTVYYTNSVNTMTDLNLWQPTGELADDYLQYKHIHEELCEIYKGETNKPFGLYDVEHVFWFKGGNPFGGNKPYQAITEEELAVAPSVAPIQVSLSRLPESYVPPIVAILPRMANNEPELREAAKASGISIERAFEKSINAAWTILGYDTKLLGQGQGRVPDGQALAHDDSYAILWDAKARSNGYSLGTDDRAMKEYITTQSRDFKRRRGFRNIYFLVISGHFTDSFEDLVRSLKMETDVNEVCFVEADALVAMVDSKLRNPSSFSLGPDGIQRLFSMSGVLRATDVEELFV
jgi:hypothetical protein